MSDDELIQGAISDVEKFLYVEGEPEKTFVAKNEPLPQINLGHKEVVDTKQSLEENKKGLFITGVGWTGISTQHLMIDAGNIAEKVKSLK